MPIAPQPNIEPRSDQMQEILGTPPSWLVRWGITVMLIVVAIVLAGAALFGYPTLVYADARISAENPPAMLVARSSGRMQRIMASDGQWVRRGDTLAVIDNAARYDHVVALSHLVAPFDTLPTWEQAPAWLLAALQRRNLVLGDLQPAYAALSDAITAHALFEQQQLHQQRIDAIAGELKAQQRHTVLLQRQLQLAGEDLALAQRQFARDSLLLAQGVLAPADLEPKQAALIAKRQSIEGMRINQSSAQIAVEQLRLSMAETALEQQSQRQSLANAVGAALSQLRSALAQWERAYLLVASSSGMLTHMGVWSDLQEVQAGSPVFAITPDTMGRVLVYLTLPPSGVGRIANGHRALVKLESFPYMEYGVVEAEVVSIAAAPDANGLFPAVAALPQGAYTTLGMAIPLERELTGVAEIATDAQTVFQRLFGWMRYVSERNRQKV